MKIACLGERLSLLGLGLAGVKTLVSVREDEDINGKLRELVSSNEFGLIIITSNIYHRVEETVKELESVYTLPVFLQIPEMKLLAGVEMV
jgi:vacuolar-type H+-ATPase subunit F/Vma7